MKPFAFLALALVLAGCSASGEQDPFAYTKKPLYAGGFDMARLAGSGETQEFRVTDGSIAEIDLRVWINATAGAATVVVTDPSGRQALSTTETTETTVGLQLGVWTVRVEGEAGSAGLIHILATRK